MDPTLEFEISVQQPTEDELSIRAPAVRDAPQIWRLVQDSGVLDPNSAYLYLLLCRDFRDTCLVATRGASIQGFVTGYRIPGSPSILFIWQVGVAADAQRQGIASLLLRELVQQCRQTSLTAIEATVAPSNVASRRLFESLARVLQAPMQDVPDGGFDTADFPHGNHEPEPRIRIGPLSETTTN